MKSINGSGFSEFETYGNYLLTFYPELYKERLLKTNRSGFHDYGHVLTMDELQWIDYDTVSFEDWDKINKTIILKAKLRQLLLQINHKLFR